jgi:hypothetical protein
MNKDNDNDNDDDNSYGNDKDKDNDNQNLSVENSGSGFAGLDRQIHGLRLAFVSRLSCVCRVRLSGACLCLVLV